MRLSFIEYTTENPNWISTSIIVSNHVHTSVQVFHKFFYTHRYRKFSGDARNDHRNFAVTFVEWLYAKIDQGVSNAIFSKKSEVMHEKQDTRAAKYHFLDVV